jgi:hypothetical protein
MDRIPGHLGSRFRMILFVERRLTLTPAPLGTMYAIQTLQLAKKHIQPA